MNTINQELASCILWIATPILLLIIGRALYCLIKKPGRAGKFYLVISALAFLGGAWAFLLPLAINSGFAKDDDGPVLRQLLIYITGGILGIFTIGETHRRNNQEKVKNGQDHERQIHAERRSRYSEAVKQLADNKAPIRMGGVYTLVGLADEWISDHSLPQKERHKEGQIIINSLCAYIRSPFDLAERTEELKSYSKDLKKDFKGDREKFEADRQAFTQDQARLREEQEVRQTILIEMRKRLSRIIKNKHLNEFKIGTWSHFDYNFKDSPFFYEVDLSGAIFAGNIVSFEEATFGYKTNLNKINRATSHPELTFITLGVISKLSNKIPLSHNPIFPDNNTISFNGSTFNGDTTFNKAILEFSEISFKDVKFNGNASFEDSIFAAFEASFKGTNFAKDAVFKNATFGPKATFKNAVFAGENTSFEGANFTQIIDFPEEYEFSRRGSFSTEDSCTSFKGATFMGVTTFKNATFNIENAYFKEAEFTKVSKDGNYTTSFGDTFFAQKVSFKDAKFACGSKNNFYINPKGGTKKIDFYDHITWDKHNRICTSIPKECIVFDPKTGKIIPHAPDPNGSA